MGGENARPGTTFFESSRDQYGSENADPYMGIGVMVPVDMLHLDDLPSHSSNMFVHKKNKAD